TLLGTTFISIGVGLSASMKSKTKVIIAVLGFFIFFVFPGLWGWILFGVLFLATGNLPIPGQNYPTWYVFFQRLTPNGAYSPVSNAFMDLGEFEQQVDLSRLLSGTDTVPFYLSEWVALIVLLIWIVVPVVLGYLRFKKADLT
ncbi:MAG: ABC transporter permease subunit, partial [Halobacteria archaeon]|nr:ABC transporter permease subunit [Halobacteria archaeon]